MKFACPFCQQSYEGTEEHIGMEYQCEYCQHSFVFKPSEEQPKPAIAENQKVCPFCGETILAAAMKCRFCGEFLDSKVKSNKYDRVKYVLYALFLGNFGAHCFYVDKMAKGWGHFVLCFLSLVAPILIGEFCAKEGAMPVFCILHGINCLWAVFEAFDDPNRTEE